MTKDELARIGIGLSAVGSAIAERVRQEGQSGKGPFQFLDDTLLREATHLHHNGAPEIAQGLLTLRAQIKDSDDGKA